MSNIPRGRGCFIYALRDPRDGSFRYVGKTIGYLNSRFKRHLYEARNTTTRTHKLAWIRSLLRQNLEPQLYVLGQWSAEAELAALERMWIQAFRVFGHRLTNGTDGGEGMPNPSEATREKLRARPVNRPTPQQRAASSAHLKQMWADPAFRARRIAMNEARRIHPKKDRMTGEELRLFKIENAKRMGAGNKGVPKSPAHRAKLAAATRAQIARDGHPRQKVR